MGRQPFMVYGLLTVPQGVSANTSTEVLAGLIGLWVVYLGLMGLDIYLLSVTARAGLTTPEAQIASAPSPDYDDVGFSGEPEPASAHREG
jgi:cytochrome d ubiquinol oxidase subunit I